MNTKLSVNINKVALIRNARGGNLPDLVQFAMDCESFGAQGITVHPRPDQRHVRYSDIPRLKSVVKSELNIEGYPSPDFIQLIESSRPDQCTLVPDPPGVLTSDAGWDMKKNMAFLTDIIQHIKSLGVRVSLFTEADGQACEDAWKTGTDRVEFYTGPYAYQFSRDPEKAVQPYIEAARIAKEAGLGVNAGHDLNLENLHYFVSRIPWTLEVSIGHALISDALYFGIKNTILMYLNCLDIKNSH
jgi:pyridoxine 5-phosphate synthase